MSAALFTNDPHRLAALCELWQNTEREIWLTLQGRSMLPTLPPGSRLRLRCRKGEPQIGQVVAYRDRDALVVHRLVEIAESTVSGERRLICQGDGNARPDLPIHPDDVVGVVVEIRLPSASERVRYALRYTLRRCWHALRAAYQGVLPRSPRP